MKRYFILATLFCCFIAPATAQTQATPATPATPSRPAFRPYSKTFYTAHTELFAEYRPLILNTPARFTAHLTNVGDVFTACTDAEVTLTLFIDGKEVWKQTLEHSVSQGVYRFPIKAETAGTGRVTIQLKKPAYSEKFTLDSVVVFADSSAAAGAQSRIPLNENPDEISYAKEKSWTETFATALVETSHKHIIVKQTAILMENGTSYVLVQDDPEHFRKQQVETGERIDKSVVIEMGLHSGERIVVLGADKISVAAMRR